ncbi:MAG: hypothetical protein WBQ25_17655 [Nitrososphaeraceae archaeon]
MGYLEASENKPHSKANRHFNPQITLVIENIAKTSARHGLKKRYSKTLIKNELYHGLVGDSIRKRKFTH